MYYFDAGDGEEICFLTDVSLLHQAHHLALEPYPNQRRGVLNEGALSSAIDRPAHFHYYQAERNILRLAAILWFGVSMAHGYEDGNKRTAFLFMTAFLEANGVELAADSGYPGHFINRCFAENNVTEDRLYEFLCRHCRWIQETGAG